MGTVSTILYMGRKQIIKVFKRIPTLKTENLILRKMSVCDYKDMYEYARQSVVTRYLLWNEHESPDHTYNYLKAVNECYKKGDFFDWAVILKESGKMIGTCGFASFDFDNSRAEIGYVINPSYWGRGIATEAVKAVTEFAFRELGINRVEARFIEGNNASRRVMEKCSMTFEGFHKQYMLIKGEYRNIGICAVTKDCFTYRNTYLKEEKRLFF